MEQVVAKRYQWRKDQRKLPEGVTNEDLIRQAQEQSGDLLLDVIHNLAIEIHNLNMVLELKDHAMRDTMDNNSARGYTIQAMKDAGFTKGDINKVLKEMYLNFDDISVEQAEKIYYDWKQF